jgi:hypothetical protein
VTGGRSRLQAARNRTFSDHWYAALRVLKIRVRGIYSMKDTFVTTALTERRTIIKLQPSRVRKLTLASSEEDVVDRE